jgi:hypothetical protein
VPQRIVDPSAETPFLFVLSDLQPDFEEPDAGVYDVFFDLRDQLQEFSMIIFAAETHHVFHAGSVVPAAIENHDFAAGRELLDVALRV